MPRFDPDQLAERAAKRKMATRYSGNMLTYREFTGWLAKYLHSDVRQGRINAELLVTREAFDNLPGDQVERFGNGQGEDVFRKKFAVPGSPTVEIKLTLIEPNPDEWRRREE